jgi:hypothetical protein
VKGRGKGEREIIARTGTFGFLLNVCDIGKVMGSCDMQEAQFRCGLTIELIGRIYGHVQKS